MNYYLYFPISAFRKKKKKDKLCEIRFGHKTGRYQNQILKIAGGGTLSNLKIINQFTDKLFVFFDN